MLDRDTTHTRRGDALDVPATTAWPMIAALGVSLAAAGLVTHVIVTCVGGALMFAAAIGWWREVLPVEHLEIVALRPLAERARPIVPVPERVEQLQVGEGGHRMRIPVEVHPYSAGIRGGIFGGAVMALLAAIFGLVAFKSIWYPINLLAATALPSLAAADTGELKSFSALGLLIAVVVHGTLSVLMGLLYAFILPMMPRRPIFMGGVVGPLLWTGLIWASLGIINPALNERIHWRWFVASQVGFGLACGIVVARTERITTMQSLPFVVRAGLEVPGVDDEGRAP